MIASVPFCKKIKANRVFGIKTSNKKMNSKTTINKLSKEKVKQIEGKLVKFR